jgi:hypothetical protein
MLKKIIFLFTLHLTMSGFSQQAFYKTYDWEEKPNYSTFITNPEEDIIFFKDKSVSEFYYNAKNEFLEFYIEHNIIWLNSDEKIEQNNKVYLPHNSSSEILVNKARVITKEGKVIVLDDSKILTAKNEETNQVYKYFAFEGIAKGSFIEYYYVVKRHPLYSGNRLTFQSSCKKNNVEFDLYSPENLVFEFKSYNGLPEIERDTLQKGKLHWKLHVKSIDKLEEEKEAPYRALLKHLVYKLDRNLVNNTNNISSYATFSKNIYDFLAQDVAKKEVSSIEKIIKETGILNTDDDITKIRKLENYLKSNIYISAIKDAKYEDINSIVSSKAADEAGLMKLYIACLKSVKVNSEIVVTCNRSENQFDKNFESGNFLDEYLLYFPSVDKFTSVKDLDARVGFPPAQFTDNFGLFIKEVVVGTYKSAIGKVKYIKAPTAKDSENNMDINVVFDKDDVTQTKIKFNHTYGGYCALDFQPYFSLMTKDKVEDLYNNLIKSVNQNMTIKDKVIENDKMDFFGIKPFKITANTESNVFVDKAGNNYLFKLGELIGPQIQMYQEKERVLPYSYGYNKVYERKITVEIPQGYTISNLKDINIHYFYEKEAGVKLFEFNSHYELKGNILTVYANEFYDINIVEKDFFEPFRKVINGAADFNKIVLVIEPIK